MAGGAAEFTIAHVDPADVDAALTFYDEHPDHHLWPRDRDYLEALALDGALYVARRSKGAIVGACYLKVQGGSEHPEEAERELGGILLLDELKGQRVASTLTRAAMAIIVAQSSEHYVPIIAHVHEHNDAPRGLLTSLGFVRNAMRDETVPPAIAPPSMRRNSTGDLVGHVFEFQRGRLRELAGWVEEPLDPRFRAPLLTKRADDIAATLRFIAAG